MTEVFRETRKSSVTPKKYDFTRDADGFEDGNNFDLVIKREDELLLPDPDRVNVRNIRTTVTHASNHSPRPARPFPQENYHTNYHTFNNAATFDLSSPFKPEPYRAANFTSTYRSTNPFHEDRQDYHDPLIRSDHRSPYNYISNTRSRNASPLRASSPYRHTSTFLVDGHTLHKAHDHLDRLDDLARSQERDINLLLGLAHKPDHLHRTYSPARTTHLDRSLERTLRAEPPAFNRSSRDLAAPAEVVYHDADLLPKILSDYPELRKNQLEFRKLNDEKDINDSLLSISKNLLEEARASLTRIRGASAIRSSTPSKSAKTSPVKPVSTSSYTSIRLNTVDNEKKHLKDDHNIDIDKMPTSSHNTPTKPFAPQQPSPSKPLPTNSSAVFNNGRPAPAPAPPKPAPSVQPGLFPTTPVSPPPAATTSYSRTAERTPNIPPPPPIRTTSISRNTENASIPPPPPVIPTVSSYSRTTEKTYSVPAPPLQTKPAIPPPPPLVPAPKPPKDEQASQINRSSNGFSASAAPNQTLINTTAGSHITPSTYQRNSTTTYAAPSAGLDNRTTQVNEDKKVSPDGTVTTTIKRTTVTTSNFEEDNPATAPVDPVKTTITNSTYNFDLPPSQGNQDYTVTRKVTTTTYENEVPRTSYSYSRNY